MEARFVPETITTTLQESYLRPSKGRNQTFGWPIGVTLKTDPNTDPRPTENGIKAEISIAESQISGAQPMTTGPLPRTQIFTFYKVYLRICAQKEATLLTLELCA